MTLPGTTWSGYRSRLRLPSAGRGEAVNEDGAGHAGGTHLCSPTNSVYAVPSAGTVTDA